MIYKVAYIDENIFQIGDDSVPIDELSLTRLAQSLSSMDETQAKNWVEQVKQTKEGNLEEKTAEKGVIVDMYEVDYPPPANPMKETEELASRLNEKEDFVTQYVFPSSETQDVLVGLRQDILKEKPTEVPELKEATKRNWRQVLSWQEDTWTSVIQDRLKHYALPIYKKLEKKDRYGDYLYVFDSWTTSQWLTLMNMILHGIGPEAWALPGSEFPQEGEHGCYIVSGVMLQLDYGDDSPGLRRANLVFDNEDHTAWVIETRKGSGAYKNYDIGGS
ncbi:MAG: hypothetical protein WC346_11270 [Methanogenium sp.]|jgi:hypothetical protein